MWRGCHLVVHHSIVVSCLLIVRNNLCTLFESKFFFLYIRRNGIKTKKHLLYIICWVLRFTQYMTNLYAVATFFHKLNYVETILCLDNLWNLVRVGEAECDGCKFWLQLSFAHKIEFSATTCRTGVLGIEQGKSWKTCLLVCYTLGVFAQLAFHTFNLFDVNFGFECYHLHLNLLLYKRNTVFGQRIVEATYKNRRNLDFTDNFLLHAFHHLHIIKLLAVHFANFGRVLIEILLHFLLWTYLTDDITYLRLNLTHYFCFINNNTVQCSLMNKQLLHSKVLADNTIWVTLESSANTLPEADSLLNIGTQNTFVADNPFYTVNNIILSNQTQRLQQRQYAKEQYFSHHFISFQNIIISPDFNASSYKERFLFFIKSAFFEFTNNSLTSCSTISRGFIPPCCIIESAQTK